ncbi:MAG: hypothetical protein PVG14_08285 [Anaerolineales bacterium]|jgi:hypothetical protein
MWKKIEKYAPLFASAVLTGVDEQGYPFGLRCQPKLDLERRLLRVKANNTIRLQDGPACLLFHSHDERLWNQKSFVLSGELEASREGWDFRPVRFIPGMGLSGIRSYWSFITKGRRRAKNYLVKRGLPRPKVDWEAFLGWVKDAPSHYRYDRDS